jgi:hypothetical protein
MTMPAKEVRLSPKHMVIVKGIRVILGVLLSSCFPIPYCTHVPIHIYIHINIHTYIYIYSPPRATI